MLNVRINKNPITLLKIIPASTLALTVGALGLVLGLAATPVMADRVGENECHSHDKNCEPSGGSDSTFKVAVVTADTNPTPPNPVNCSDGTIALDNSSVNFVGCDSVKVALETSSKRCAGSSYDIELELFMIVIKDTKNPSVSLFMWNGPGNETTYQTDSLRVNIGQDSGTGFEITGINGNPIATNVELTKIHQPCRGDVVRGISVDKLVFTRHE